MRKVLAGRLVAFVVCAVSQWSNALACECQELSLAERIDSADAIFLADVYAAGRELRDGEFVLHVKVDSAVSVKGSIPDYLFSPFGSASCGGSVEVPSRVWFFVNSEGMFQSCGGYVPGLSSDGAELWKRNRERVLETKRELAKIPFEEFAVSLMCDEEVKLIDIPRNRPVSPPPASD